MSNKVLFSEKQQFNQWWLWLILLGVNGLFLFGVFKQVLLGQQFGDRPMSDSMLIITAVLMLILSLFFFCFRLDTEIKSDGIYVRFFPFLLSFKHYPWGKLSKIYVRAYSPITEYGGWGFRLGLFGKGRAYNVSGNKGLQLEFTDNTLLLIGTNKPNELTEALRKIGQLKP
jgi:hypothetical protein